MQLRTIGVFAAAAVIMTGCAGPTRKLSRGVNNVTEFARLGELRRSMEQTALWDGTDQAYTLGFARGMNRSFARTGVGLWEILTFPVSDVGDNYDPIFLPEQPVYPDASRPSFLADPSWSPDTNLGFSGGSIAPHVPGSKFQIFDY
jgi:putative exosortase-associated protein (TIGR04073 family)